MNGHEAADNDEANSQQHREVREQIGQLLDRERVLTGENDQLRAQLVEMKEQEKMKYDDLMVQYRELSANANIKREYEDDGLDKQGTSNNQVTVKTEWDDDEEVKVEIKEELKEEEDDHDIIIKQEYEDIKTESDDVKVEIKDEIKEEDDDDDNRGCGLRLVKKELASDDDASSEQLSDRVNVCEVQANFAEPIDILSRDQVNSPTHSVFELSPSANEQMQLTNSSQIEQSVDQQVDKADHEPNETDNHEQNQLPSTNQSKTLKRTRKSLTTEGSSLENSSTNCKVSTPGPKKRSKRTRVPTELDRTETVQEVSAAVAVDQRQVDQQNGGEGEGLGQTEDDDDETEMGEEEGGHYKIEIIKLKCNEDGCKDEVASRDELNDHLRIKHGIFPYRCLAQGCGERGELGPHVQDNHSNISTWSCAHCIKTYKSQSGLYDHLHCYHFEGQFKCGYDACHYDRVATFRSEILAHQRSVHPKTTVYTCQFNNCGKSFNHKSHFNRHLLSHSGVKAFPCEVTGCGKSFGLKQNLERHQRIHQNVKPFKCTWNMCDYPSTNQSNLITHIRTQHFNLPKSQKKQRELGIEDNRDPRDYLQQ